MIFYTFLQAESKYTLLKHMIQDFRYTAVPQIYPTVDV